MLLDTCTLLDPLERRAVADLVRDFEGEVIIVGAVVEELERKKKNSPELVRHANAALRCIEEWERSGKAFIENLKLKPQRTYADEAILESIERHIADGALVTLITADIALRVRARGAFSSPHLMTVDSKSLIDGTLPKKTTAQSANEKQMPRSASTRAIPVNSILRSGQPTQA